MDWASDLARKRHVKTYIEAPPGLYLSTKKGSRSELRWVIKLDR